MKYQRERAWSVSIEIQPLIEQHWQEVAHYKDIPLQVDWNKYLQLDEAGMLRIFTAREAGLRGYVIYIVNRNMHYMSSIQAMQDVLFIDPVFRGRMAGARLLGYSHQYLANEGVQVVYQHVKKAKDLEPLLTRMGYEPIDILYGKRLDGTSRQPRGRRARETQSGRQPMAQEVDLQTE